MLDEGGLRCAPCRLMLAVVMSLPFGANAADGAQAPPDRAHSLFNSFELMCNLRAPDFEQLSAQAAAMRMQALEDESSSTANGEAIRRKGWVGMLSTGAFALRIESMSGSKGTTTSCAIEGPVPDAEVFRGIVISTFRLTAVAEVQVHGTERSYYWDGYAGDGTTLVVRDMDKPSGHFVQVKLLNMIKAEAR